MKQLHKEKAPADAGTSARACGHTPHENKYIIQHCTSNCKGAF